MERKVTCANCRSELWVEGTDSIRHFLCEVCQATTFLPESDQEIITHSSIRSSLDHCPMCGADATNSGSSCTSCGEPLPTEVRKVTKATPLSAVAKFTRVTYPMIRWYQWGTGCFGTLFCIVGLVFLYNATTSWKDPTFFIWMSLISLGLGTAILFRRLGAMGVAMFLLTCGSMITLFMSVILFFFVRGFVSNLTWDAMIIPGSLAVMILINGLGWKVWGCGKAIQRAGFSLFLTPQELPIARKLIPLQEVPLSREELPE